MQILANRVMFGRRLLILFIINIWIFLTACQFTAGCFLYAGIVNMSKIHWIYIIFFLPFVVSCSYNNELTLFNCNIVDTESGRILSNQTIYIKDGIIKKIAPSERNIKDGEVDLSGKYVMPGLIDSHTHWGSFAFDSTSAAELSKEYLKCGVTTVRDLGSNFTNIKRYMDHLEAGHFHGPDVYYSSFWATGDYYLQEDDIKGWDGTKYDCPWSRMFSIKDSTDAAIEKAVLEAKEIGCTGFKLYINYSKEDLARVIPIIKKHGMKVWAHATQYNGAKSLDVAQSGVEVVSHSYMLSNDYTIRDTITACELDSIRTVCKELIKNNVVLDITAHIAISAEMNFAIPITKEAYSQGVEFVVGTDYFGCAVPDEIKQLKKLGFGNLDILRAATSTGAKILGMAGKLGIIKEGAQADIIVLSGNPVEDLNVLNNIEATILDGKKNY